MGTNTISTRRRSKLTALVAGGLLLGGAAAGVIGASAASAESSSGSSTAAPSGAPSAGAQGAAGETIVTGTEAATLRAAALQAVPGATVDRIETDSGDAAYEVHVTKSDGSRVTVKFDSDLKQTAVEDGMGTGPGGRTDGTPTSGPSGTQG